MNVNRLGLDHLLFLLDLQVAHLADVDDDSCAELRVPECPSRGHVQYSKSFFKNPFLFSFAAEIHTTRMRSNDITASGI